MPNLGRYSKSVTAVIGQALTYATLYYGGNKYVAAAVAVASALGVSEMTIRRLESGRSMGRDIDHYVAAYAYAAGIEDARGVTP